MARLELRSISMRFATHRGDSRLVLDRCTLAVAPGEVVALLGPSGSGKSTLLRIAAGLLVPTTGSVHLDGVDITTVPTHLRDIGMVFQDQQLFPHLTVRQNVGFALRMRRLDRTAVDTRTDAMLHLVGLSGFGHRAIGSLSGGEATRVALARSLAPEPKVLLLDEPFTGLDRALHDQLVPEVATMLRTSGTTAVLVTHDPDEAAAVADRVVQLDSLRDSGA